jgi:hypothetical protein
MRRYLFAAFPLIAAGCVFGSLEDAPRFVTDPDAGIAEPDAQIDASTGDSGDAGGPPSGLTVVDGAEFGSASYEGARVGFGAIPEGFGAVQLVGMGTARGHIIDYEGGAEQVVSYDFADTIVGGTEAAARMFDAVVDSSGFFFTTSVTPSEVLVGRCIFSNLMCVETPASGFDRGTDMALVQAPGFGPVGFLSNDGGSDLVVGSVDRNPLDASGRVVDIGGLGSTSLAAAIDSNGIMQLGWYDASADRYQTARWRAGTFADDPTPCGAPQGDVQQVEPIGTSNTVLIIQAGELRYTSCDGAILDVDLGMADDIGVTRFSITHTGQLTEAIAWQTTDDLVYVGLFDTGDFSVDKVTPLDTVPNTMGIRVAWSGGESPIGVLVWGDRLRTWIARD